MAISWAGNVAVVAPELANAPGPLQTLILSMVNRWLDADAWGEFLDDGATYLAAHLGSLSYPGGTSVPGAITSETLGAMSRSYQLPPDVTGELATTKYGVFFKTLLRVAIGPGVIVS